MIQLQSIHHIAVICSNYTVSKKFYTEILGFQVKAENYRAERQSFKCDLALNDAYIIELFSFPNPPPRASYPEACGYRHLAFIVADIHQAVLHLNTHGIAVEEIREDPFTGDFFCFFNDPDQLPIELVQRR